MAIIKLFLVILTVLITLVTATLLNYGAKETNMFSINAICIIFLVLVINFIKFKIWGLIYKRYNLSESYPLISLFFPLVYIVTIYNGEAVFEIKKVIGIICILVGIYIINSNEKMIWF